LDGLDTDAEEEDGDGKADEDCCNGVKELAEPPKVECLGYIFRRDVDEMATCSIVNSG
jgi:hypothetical protein